MGDVVLVTEPEYRKGRPEFEAETELEIRPAPPGESALARRVEEADCRAVIVGVESYTGPLYRALGSCPGAESAIIARFGVGHDGVNKGVATENGIVVTNTPDVLDRSVAEHAVGLMLAVARRIPRLSEEMHAERWHPREGREIAGKKLAVVGFGTIGQEVARIAHFGLSARVVAADVIPSAELEEETGHSLAGIMEEFGLEAYTTKCRQALAEADIVSLHIPGTPANRHFVDADLLSALKGGAFLINTSRGTVVDEGALYDALEDGQLGGAALDVYEHEPYAPVDPQKDLRTLDNVVLTPHVASNTREANARMARASLNNVRCFLDDRLDELDLVD